MRLSDLRFLLAWLLPLLAIYSVTATPTITVLGTLGIWWSVVLLDALLPGGQRSPAPWVSAAPPAYFRLVLRSYVLLHLALIGAGCLAAARADWLVAAGIAFTVGFVTGSQGITFAHELGHSKSRLDRTLAWVLMTSVCYGHFMVEHYRGHHPRAATLDDPASARFGESLYRFLPRTLAGSFASGWQLEAQRLRQFRSTWWRSPLVWSSAVSVLMLAMPVLLWPAATAVKVAAFLAAQSIVAFLLLEVVNYIEHYGLQRATIGEGSKARREAFGIAHAWNADHLVSNSMLANLQRHSDHHMHAWKPYPALALLPGPQLPAGYPGCIALALVPPLWFSVIHPRLQSMKQSSEAGMNVGASA